MDREYFLSYFKFIANVASGKAKEHVEKQKNLVPGQLQSILTQFAQCEKNYSSLAFLEQKWFGRRDPLKSTYLALQAELNTFIKQFDVKDDSCTVISTCEGLSNFCSCRVDCIELYETSLRTFSLKDFEKSINDLIQKHAAALQCQTIKPMVDAYVAEFQTFRRLVGASLLIAEWSFFDALIELHKIRQTLSEWQPLLNKDQPHPYSFRSGLFGFGEKQSTSPVSAVYQWMAKYFQSLVSKFSLYFYDQLSSQGKGEEMKTILAKTSCDYVAKSLNFCKKFDSTYVILCSTSNENTVKLVDESHRTTHIKILELPTNSPENIWSNLDSFLYNKSEEITFEKVIYYFDKQINYSFYAAQCDPGVILIVAAAVTGKKSEKDSHILNFINEISAYLKPKRIFALLRPGSK